MNYIVLVRNELMNLNNNYKNNSLDNYDFYEQHIKYVVMEATRLAKKYNASLEIVEIGALLHDIALIKNIGDRANHHVNGAILARELLEKIEYPKDKIEKVVGCVLHHRSSKNATNIEEICVADADILAHFDNIPLIFNIGFNNHKIKISNIKIWIREFLEKDYNDLSELTKEWYKKEYENICKILFID